MAYLTICYGCQEGDHKNHQEVVQAVPEGVCGGAICGCEGQCAQYRMRFGPRTYEHEAIKIIQEAVKERQPLSDPPLPIDKE